MRRDVALARAHGASGVVFGVLTGAGEIDVQRTRSLVADAAPLEAACHRAFDVSPIVRRRSTPSADCGIRRVLTSGGARSASEGAEAIASLVRRSAGRVRILAGGSIRAANVAEVVRGTGVPRCTGARSVRRDDESGRANPSVSFGLAGGAYQVADREALRAIRLELDAHRVRRGREPRRSVRGSRPQPPSTSPV